MPIATWSASAHIPGQGGLGTCDPDHDDDYAEVEGAIAAPSLGRVIGKFAAYPSLQRTEWGLILFETNDVFTLRVVQFESPLWYSACHEIGTVARDPDKAEICRDIDEIAISRELAQLIDQTLSKEVSAAKLENGRGGGFDGVIYRFGSGGACAQTWSPATGTRPAQLIEAIYSLRTFSGVPTSWLRRIWEPSVISKWKVLAEPNKALQRTLEDSRR